MKRQLFICLLFCIGIYSNAQEIIEKPKQSNHYKKRVEITKVELTNNETILHITFKKNKNDSILIPKTIYITDENSSEKKFVIKSKGVVLEKKISF